MNEDFWRNKWASNEIGFHEGHPNGLLIRHIGDLQLVAGQRLLLPLCGKTNDIPWLLSKGFQVVGIELVESAIQQLFDGLRVTPEIVDVGGLKHYRAASIDILVGDIFKASAGMIGKVDAIYDRAALVALPAEMRVGYADHLTHISGRAKQLLVSFDYDQTQMNGPPFSVPEEELKSIYGKFYDLNLLESAPLAGGLKGKCSALEQAWLLRPRRFE